MFKMLLFSVNWVKTCLLHDLFCRFISGAERKVSTDAKQISKVCDLVYQLDRKEYSETSIMGPPSEPVRISR